jgi:hypothetical protein
MSAAKQVYARALQVTVPKGVVKKLLSTALESLLGGRPTNIDTIPLRASQGSEQATAIVENASALSIPSHPVRVMGSLLSLTNRQRELLRSMTQSVTANEYGKVEGNDAVFVSSTLAVAAVTLHALGFSRDRTGGTIASQRFVKTIETESGRVSVVTARVEVSEESGKAYTSICVD